jgi:two-component system cell cycle sensor histidine kinase/response regulator CckA
MKDGEQIAGQRERAGLGLQAFLERVQLAGVQLDERGTIVYCNPRLAELLGRRREELVGADWFDRVVASDRREEIRRLFADVARGPAPSFGHELDVERRDGERRRLRWTTTVLRDGEGRFAGVACVGDDVTESRRAAEAHRLARAALDSSETAMAIGDAEARLVYVNSAFLRLWGYAREEHVVGRSALELWADPAAAVAFTEAIVRDGRWTGELVARRADGREATLNVHANLFSDPETGTIRVITTFQDLTDLRRAEERLLGAQRLARVGYWSIDLSTSKVTWGEETFRLFGISPDGFAGTQDAFLALVHPGDRPAIEAAISRMFDTDEPVSMDFRVVLPGGEERVVHSEAGSVRDAYGRAVELRGMVQDVTDRVRLEEQLRQSQKMEAVGALAGGIAHDFNNMLTVILSLGGVALDALAPWEPARADIEEIVATARRAESLTRQILAFARRQFTRPVALDLNATISGATRMIERLIGEHIVVRLELAPELPNVVADPRQLEQVLVNLAVNARDAMPGGGTLEVSTRRLAGHREACERIELVVRDSGAGMDAETRARAFDPFFTTKPPGHGTGLGLAVVHGIVQQCGGSVRLESSPGRGTAAVIELPVAAPGTPAPAAPAGRRGRGPVAGRTILLVEDEAAVRGVAVRCLEGAGYRVVPADGGEAALRLAAHAPAIDLLLTDVVMPGMGGAELAERLRAARPGLRVLFMSGFSASLPEALAPTGGSLVSKPFTPAVLLARVAEAIEGAAPPAADPPA